MSESVIVMLDLWKKGLGSVPEPPQEQASYGLLLIPMKSPEKGFRSSRAGTRIVFIYQGRCEMP
jgi:hypothetical protein